MKFLNQLICVVSFFAIGSVSARLVKGQQVPPSAPAPSVPTPKPVPGALAPAPATGPKQTYKQLHDSILRMTAKEIFTPSEEIQSTFITKISSQAKNADIGSNGFKFLLQTARDKFAPFNGDNDHDLSLLQNINKKIDELVAMFQQEYGK